MSNAFFNLSCSNFNSAFDLPVDMTSLVNISIDNFLICSFNLSSFSLYSSCNCVFSVLHVS